MLRIVRNNYQVGTIGITAVAAAIGTTLLNGDILLWTTTNQNYGYITGSALTLATN